MFYELDGRFFSPSLLELLHHHNRLNINPFGS